MSSPMMKRMLGFLPPAAGPAAGTAGSAWASSLGDGSGAVAAGLAVVCAPLGLGLVLASPLPDLANCDEQAMMPPIAARARQAANVLFSLNMMFSLGSEISLGTGSPERGLFPRSA